MKIQKIRSIRDAVESGRLRQLDFFDGVNDMQVRRWDWFHVDRQICITVRWPQESVEGRMMALYQAKKGINRWLRKSKGFVQLMMAVPDITVRP